MNPFVGDDPTVRFTGKSHPRRKARSGYDHARAPNVSGTAPVPSHKGTSPRKDGRVSRRYENGINVALVCGPPIRAPRQRGSQRCQGAAKHFTRRAHTVGQLRHGRVEAATKASGRRQSSRMRAQGTGSDSERGRTIRAIRTQGRGTPVKRTRRCGPPFNARAMGK